MIAFVHAIAAQGEDKENVKMCESGLDSHFCRVQVSLASINIYSYQTFWNRYDCYNIDALC